MDTTWHGAKSSREYHRVRINCFKITSVSSYQVKDGQGGSWVIKNLSCRNLPYISLRVIRWEEGVHVLNEALFVCGRQAERSTRGKGVFTKVWDEFESASDVTNMRTNTRTTPSGKRHLKLKSGGEEIKVFSLKKTHLITLRNSVKTYSFCMFVAPTVTCTQEADVFQDSAARPKHQQWGGGVEYYICWLKGRFKVHRWMKWTGEAVGKDKMSWSADEIILHTSTHLNKL